MKRALKKISEWGLFVFGSGLVLFWICFFVDRHYNEKYVELLRLSRNHIYQSGYEHGIQSTMHEFIEWVPAYAVHMPKESNYSTYILERENGAIPLLYFGDSAQGATISNCVIASSTDVKSIEGIRLKHNLDGSGNLVN